MGGEGRGEGARAGERNVRVEGLNEPPLERGGTLGRRLEPVVLERGEVRGDVLVAAGRGRAREG